MKSISAMARRIAEVQWWVMVRNEPYSYWKSGVALSGSGVMQVRVILVDPLTSKVLSGVDEVEGLDE